MRQGLTMSQESITRHTGRGEMVSLDIRMSHIQTKEGGEPKWTSETKRIIMKESNSMTNKAFLPIFRKMISRTMPQKLISPTEMCGRIPIMRREADLKLKTRPRLAETQVCSQRRFLFLY
jgi:hypothetical protein